MLKAAIDASGDVVVTVHVQPGARRTEVSGQGGGRHDDGENRRRARLGGGS